MAKQPSKTLVPLEHVKTRLGQADDDRPSPGKLHPFASPPFFKSHFTLPYLWKLTSHFEIQLDLE